MIPVILPDGTMNTKNAVLYLQSKGIDINERQLRQLATDYSDWPGGPSPIKRNGKWYFHKDLLDAYKDLLDAYIATHTSQKPKQWLSIFAGIAALILLFSFFR